MDEWVVGHVDMWVDGCKGEWMDGWLDGYVGGWMDGWMDGLVDERVNERNGCVNGCVVECKDGRLDGWMIRYMVAGLCALVFVSSRPAGPLAWRKARKPIGRGASGVD